MRELKQKEFLDKNLSRIYREALNNEDKIGYVSVYADNNFKLVENSLEFVEGDFDTSEFTLGESPTVLNPQEIEEAFFIYYVILWADNKTKWMVKELALKGRTNDLTQFKMPED